MASNITQEIQERRKLFMNLNVRKLLKTEILTQAQCTLVHRPGTHFDVVVKRPRDATNGELLDAWKALLIRYKNDNDEDVWVYDSGNTTRATQEEALSCMLEKLQQGGFRGMKVPGSGPSDGEQEIREYVGGEEGGEELGEQR